MKKLAFAFIVISILSCSSENDTTANNSFRLNPFNGQWSGTYTETISESSILDNGTWQGRVDDQNNFSGTQNSLIYNQSFDFSGTVSEEGDSFVRSGTTEDGIEFFGVFYGNEASGVFVSNRNPPANYGTWKGTKNAADNDYIFSEFVGTWSLLTETINSTNSTLSTCELNSTIVVSPTVLIVNDYSEDFSCGFVGCSIDSLETWNISYSSDSSATVTQTSSTDFCNGEFDATDTSLEISLDFEVIGDVISVTFELPNGDGTFSVLQRTYQRI
jgi:hypothetical protein